MIKELLAYLLSRIASILFLHIHPIEVSCTPSGDVFITRKRINDKEYYIAVMQHLVTVQTEIYGFSKNSYFYTAEVVTIENGSSKKSVFDYIPQPTRSLFNVTKLPHVMVGTIVINYIAGLSDGETLNEREFIYRSHHR